MTNGPVPLRKDVHLGIAGLTNDDFVDATAGSSVKSPVARKRRSDLRSNDEPHIGKALRSVYDQTVGEAIPSEMLDLLGRLD